MDNPIPYAMGSGQFPGLAKLVEEAGELIQVLGQILQTGSLTHWRGDLTQPLIDELGDMIAATNYFVKNNFADTAKQRLSERVTEKTLLYRKWEEDGNPLP